MTYDVNPTENIDEVTANEIQKLKARVHCLSQQIWTCDQYPNRINILIMLSAAVAELLLLENNQQALNQKKPVA